MSINSSSKNSIDVQSKEIIVTEPKNLKEKIFGVPGHTEVAAQLSSGQINLLALGASIGTGVYLSLGTGIATCGPGTALLTYIVVGIFTWCVVLVLSQMASYIPSSGAFASYATRFHDDSLGFALGINYFLQWSFSITSEVVAAGVIAQFWAPQVPSWGWAMIFIFPIALINLTNVKNYGRIEYWGTIIKVLFIIIFIIVGLLYNWGAIKNADPPSPGLSNWKNGQAFVGGFGAFFQCVVYAFYSFGGTELVALASAEAKAPHKSIPRAAKTAIIRILLFMVLTVLVVGLNINYKDPSLLKADNNSDVAVSPITTIFVKAGFGAAKHLVNAVLLVSVLTAINSCFYASSRMLMSMAHEDKMFKVFGWTNKSGVPVPAVLVTTAIACLAFLTTIWGEGVVFTWFMNITGASAILTWLSIGYINIRFILAMKKQNRPLSDLPLKQYCFPMVPAIALLIGLFLFAGMGYGSVQDKPVDWKSPFGTYLGVAVFAICYVGWKLTHWNTDKVVTLAEADLDTNCVWPEPGMGKEVMENELEEKREQLLNGRSTVWGKVRWKIHQAGNLISL